MALAAAPPSVTNMGSTSLSGFIAKLQSLNPQYAAQDRLYGLPDLQLSRPAHGPNTALTSNCSAEVLVAPIIGYGSGEDACDKYIDAYNDRLREKMLRNLIVEDYCEDYGIFEASKEPIIRNGIERDGYNSYCGVRGGYNCFWNPFRPYEPPYEMSETFLGLQERRIGNRVRQARYESYWQARYESYWLGKAIEMIRLKALNTFYSRILHKQSPTQHVGFGMASGRPFLPEAININYISDSNINFGGSNFSQHIGPEIRSRPTIEAGSGENGGNGRLPPSGAGRGGGGRDDDDGDVYDEQFSRFMKLAAEKMRAEAAARAEAARAEAAAKSMGTLGLISRLGLLMASCWILGNPILADPSLLFKVGIATQVVTGSCFSTFAELQKKGMEFWSRLFATDILFGMTVDIAVGGVLATYAHMGLMPSASGGFFGHVQRAYSSLPSSIFGGGSPGFNISLKQDILTYFYEGILFGTAGLGCGLICHAIVNLIRTGNGNTKKSEEENSVSSIVKNAVLWGVFLPLSSDTRHQIVKRLEKLIKASPVAKQVPLTALAFAVGIRFANNIVGGLLFAHWAKRSGIMKSQS